MTFARDKGASACLGCLLMLLFLIPGIMYLLLVNRTARLTVAAYPHEGGSRVVIGGEGAGALRDVVKRLAEGRREISLAAPEEGQPRSASTLTQKLRELAALRVAGLITSEEFEAKKRNLLDKM